MQRNTHSQFIKVICHQRQPRCRQRPSFLISIITKMTIEGKCEPELYGCQLFYALSEDITDLVLWDF